MTLLQRHTQSESIFVIEGIVSELHVELGSENLLQKVQSHYKSSALATGTGAVISDLFGQAANAAMLAMYDGEDTQNFICLIDGQVACGQFGGAELLQNDHHIKAVVSRQGEVLVVHAALDEQQGYLWTGHAWGSNAEKRANWKLALFGFAGINLFWATLLIFGGGKEGFFVDMKYSFFGGGALVFLIALWANHDMKSLSNPATDVFRLLGFANPEDVNLNSYGLMVATMRECRLNETFESPLLELGEYQHRNVFCYQKAIDDGKLAMSVPKA